MRPIWNVTSPKVDTGSTADQIAPGSPIVQTPDSKHWIDLDLVSPKLLKEIRRQYDPDFNRESTASLGRSAAKIKAWARHGKLGIDILLRQKNSDGRHVVSQLELKPEHGNEIPNRAVEIPNRAFELPNGPVELSNTPSYAELDDHCCTMSQIASEEFLPRYEPQRTLGDGQQEAIGADVSSPTLGKPDAALSDRVAEIHRGNSPRFSSGATTLFGSEDQLELTEHILIRRPPTVHESTYLRSDPGSAITLEQRSTTSAAKAVQPGTHSHLQKQMFSRDIEDLLHSLRDLQARQSDKEHHMLEPPSGVDPEHVQNSSDSDTPRVQDAVRTTPRQNFVRNASKSKSKKSPFREARGIELPRSHSTKLQSKNSVGKSRKTSRRVKPTCLQGKGRSPAFGKALHGKANALLAGGEDSNLQILRPNMISAWAPRSTDPELLWTIALDIQAKILGQEHPLVYQGRSDLAKSRVSGHRSSNLSTFHQSMQMARHTLGAVHPVASSFSEAVKNLQDACTAIPDSALQTLRSRLPRLKTTSQEIESPAPMQFLRSGVDRPRGESRPNDSTPGTSSACVGTHSLISPPANQAWDVSIATKTQSQPQPSGVISSSESFPQTNAVQYTIGALPQSRNAIAVFVKLLALSVATAISDGVTWLCTSSGLEPQIEAGKVRIRWTCACGEQLYDDFIEKRPGAARELEAYLNSPRTHSPSSSTHSPSSTLGSSSSPHSNTSSMQSPPSSSTSWSSVAPRESAGAQHNGKSPAGPAVSTNGYNSQIPLYEPPWLLTCADEAIGTPKLSHLGMNPFKIRSDKDLAVSLREHYTRINKRWWRPLRLRGLTSLEFLRFEVHQNRFADIRKRPDMPPVSDEYDFQPGDLLPPVGSTYLMHLFRHPEDYEGEMIAYYRAPKKNGRLLCGVGWGISLVEGFLPARVWFFVTGFFIFGSLLFAVALECHRHNLQSAFSVASWILGLSVLVVGCLQARLG